MAMRKKTTVTIVTPASSGPIKVTAVEQKADGYFVQIHDSTAGFFFRLCRGRRKGPWRSYSGVSKLGDRYAVSPAHSYATGMEVWTAEQLADHVAGC